MGALSEKRLLLSTIGASGWSVARRFERECDRDCEPLALEKHERFFSRDRRLDPREPLVRVVSRRVARAGGRPRHDLGAASGVARSTSPGNNTGTTTMSPFPLASVCVTSPKERRKSSSLDLASSSVSPTSEGSENRPSPLEQITRTSAPTGTPSRLTARAEDARRLPALSCGLCLIVARGAMSSPVTSFSSASACAPEAARSPMRAPVAGRVSAA